MISRNNFTRPLLLSIAIALISPSVFANARSPAQIQKIARSVTLRIEATGGGNSDTGSGVLIEKQCDFSQSH